MSIREQMQEDLRAALKARDKAAVAALRATLAAIANAEAVEVPSGSRAEAPLGVVGIGAEVPRRELSAADILEIFQAEIGERRTAVADYERHGQAAEADRLRAELEVLARYTAIEPA